jgi:hypothetical protein
MKIRTRDDLPKWIDTTKPDSYISNKTTKMKFPMDIPPKIKMKLC